MFRPLLGALGIVGWLLDLLGFPDSNETAPNSYLIYPKNGENEQRVKKVFKEHEKPNKNWAPLFEDDQLYLVFSNIIKQILKSSAFYLDKSTIMLEDVNWGKQIALSYFERKRLSTFATSA